MGSHSANVKMYIKIPVHAVLDGEARLYRTAFFVTDIDGVVTEEPIWLPCGISLDWYTVNFRKQISGIVVDNATVTTES